MTASQRSATTLRRNTLLQRLAVVADQGIFSLTNFLAVWATARLADVETIGVVSLVLGLYGVTVTVSNAVAVEPGYSATVDDQGQRRFVLDEAEARSVSFFLSLVACAPFLVIAIALADDVPVWAAVAAVPLLALHETLRILLHRNGRATRALAHQLVWVATQIGVLAFASGLVDDRWRGLCAWFIGGLVSLSTMVVSSTFSLKPSDARAHLRRHKAKAWMLGLEQFVTIGSFHLAAALLVIVSGLTQAGSLQLGLTLAGPIVVLAAALRLVGINEAQRSLTDGALVSDAVQKLRWIAMLGFPVSVVWAALALIGPWDIFGRFFGDSWNDAGRVAFLVILSRALLTLSLPLNTALRLAGLDSTTLRIRTEAGLATIAGVALGGLGYGAEGAAAGMAAAGLYATLRYSSTAYRLRSAIVVG